MRRARRGPHHRPGGRGAWSRGGAPSIAASATPHAGGYAPGPPPNATKTADEARERW